MKYQQCIVYKLAAPDVGIDTEFFHNFIMASEQEQVLDEGNSVKKKRDGEEDIISVRSEP